MKASILYLLFAFILAPISGTVFAQEAGNRVYLFDSFKPATVKMKNGSKASASFNYDGSKREMVYYDKEQLMVLDGLEQVDTIFIENRKFVPFQQKFREVVPLTEGELQIDWSMKRIFLGKKGAFGQVSHSGTVQNINPGYLTGYLSTQHSNEGSNQVYSTVLKNTYYLVQKSKPRKFNSLKTFMSHFPENQQTQLADFIKNEKVDFNVPEDVAKLAGFAVTLE